MNVKSLMQSKTFWLAALQAIAGAFLVFQGAYPSVGWLVLAKSVVDVTLRYYTSTPIAGVFSVAR